MATLPPAMRPRARSAFARASCARLPLLVSVVVTCFALVVLSWGRRASVHVAAMLACDGDESTPRARAEGARLDDRACAPSSDLFAGFCLAVPLAQRSIAAAAFVERARVDAPEHHDLRVVCRDAARARGPPTTA